MDGDDIIILAVLVVGGYLAYTAYQQQQQAQQQANNPSNNFWSGFGSGIAGGIGSLF